MWATGVLVSPQPKNAQAIKSQRFLTSALSSDADQFRYLMDNALASKDALRLSLGVSLTGQQVGALTHDIVWMENRVIDGQRVLVPVLYLAQAESRNVRGSSLIQSRDLNLLTGGDLLNVGTLRASNNLSAAAGGSLYNGGLIEAGNNLTLLARDSIRNAMAGEIRGTQVNLAALKGDITNDTTAIQVRDGAGMRTLTDNGTSTISARDNLVMEAGRDLINRGALVAGKDANLTAGRDLSLIATSDTRVKHEFSDGGHKSSITTDVKNLAASVTAGGNLNMKAGQDVNIIGSTATAGKDFNVDAGRDFNVASVSDVHNVEGKEKHGKKRIKTADEQTTQVASVLTAGGNFRSQAGRDTTLVASKISAGNEAYLYSGEQMNLLAAENITHTLYDMKKNSGWGSKKTQREEVTRITNVGTEIQTGGDLTLKTGGDQAYQLAKLHSARDITLDSGGAITFEAVKDLHQESHEKTNNNAFWVSSKGKGNTDETLRQSQLIAEGSVAIKAVDGLKIDINQVNQQNVSQSIDAMVKADPKLVWLKDAEKRGDVDWRLVKEIHDSYKYSNSGLGPASQIIIAIVMAAFVGPAVMGAMGATTGGMVAAGTMSANTATFITAASGAVATGAATNATVSTINNRGNLGAVFKDVTSSDAMKGYVISGVTAGMTATYFGDLTGTQVNTTTGKITTPGLLNTWSGVGRFAANQTLQSGTSTLLSKALGQGGNASDALKGALFNTLAAASFNLVGNYTQGVVADGSVPKIAIHAMVGGLLAQATGGDFKTGALAAGANEALVTHLDSLVKGNEELLTMSSQIVGVLAAAGQSDATAAQMEKGAWVASNATQYNFLNHPDVIELEAAEKDCHPKGTCDQVKKEFDARSAANLARLDNCEATHNCAQIRAELNEGSKAIVASVERTETLNPGGSSNDLVASYRTVNEQEWTRAGPRHLNQIANLWVNGDPTWMREVSLYLDQTGFNPFGINVVPGMLPRGGAGGVGAAGTKPTINPVHETMAETGKPKWDTPQSRVDGEFGPTNNNYTDRPKVKVEDSNYITPIVNPATNKIVTEHIVAPSENAPQTASPISIPEISRADGAKATATSAAEGAKPRVSIDPPDGSFSISDWAGYPAGVPVPQGPFRLLEGTEYNSARNAANKANSALRREQGLVGQPVDVHEINPVKFGGSPTDSANKIILPRDVHRQQVTPWWNQLQKDLGK